MAHLQLVRVIPGSKFSVFDYATSPQNLGEMLEPMIEVDFLSPEVEPRRGAEFLFTMSRYGVSRMVRLRIDDVIPGSRFVYRQVEGLFSTWQHTVRVEEHDETSCVLTDIVDYSIPFGVLGHVADDMFVRSDVESILNTRQDNVFKHFQNLASDDSPSVN